MSYASHIHHTYSIMTTAITTTTTATATVTTLQYLLHQNVKLAVKQRVKVVKHTS